jgi:hypothetical protein
MYRCVFEFFKIGVEMRYDCIYNHSAEYCRVTGLIKLIKNNGDGKYPQTNKELLCIL